MSQIHVSLSAFGLGTRPLGSGRVLVHLGSVSADTAGKCFDTSLKAPRGFTLRTDARLEAIFAYLSHHRQPPRHPLTWEWTRARVICVWCHTKCKNADMYKLNSIWMKYCVLVGWLGRVKKIQYLGRSESKLFPTSLFTAQEWTSEGFGRGNFNACCQFTYSMIVLTITFNETLLFMKNNSGTTAGLQTMTWTEAENILE